MDSDPGSGSSKENEGGTSSSAPDSAPDSGGDGVEASTSESPDKTAFATPNRRISTRKRASTTIPTPSSTAKKYKLLVKGLPTTLTADEVKKLFTVYGEINECRLVTYRNGGSRGLAYVEYYDEANAHQAVSKANGMVVGDKEIAVSMPYFQGRKPPGSIKRSYHNRERDSNSKTSSSSAAGDSNPTTPNRRGRLSKRRSKRTNFSTTTPSRKRRNIKPHEESVMIPKPSEQYQQRPKDAIRRLPNKEQLRSKGIFTDDVTLWKKSHAAASTQMEIEQQKPSEVVFEKWSIVFGKYEIGCWHSNTFPRPWTHLNRIFMCEFCLKPMGTESVMARHLSSCKRRYPPGNEIYRKDGISVFEINGEVEKTYCQYLCLLSKCFLDHKMLYYDVDGFLFYVMTINDDVGCHVVGYFSKEKASFMDYNLSCILTLPPFQRKGFGKFLIDFSYLLTRVEGKVGSPEQPLSDLGSLSYTSYWRDAVLRKMQSGGVTNMADLSRDLGITPNDLAQTLQSIGMLKNQNGNQIVLKIKQDVLDNFQEKVMRQESGVGERQLQIDPDCLKWTPYQPPPEEDEENCQSIKIEESSISMVENQDNEDNCQSKIEDQDCMIEDFEEKCQSKNEESSINVMENFEDKSQSIQIEESASMVEDNEDNCQPIKIEESINIVEDHEESCQSMNEESINMMENYIELENDAHEKTL